jgi:hypothetical protein
VTTFEAIEDLLAHAAGVNDHPPLATNSSRGHRLEEGSATQPACRKSHEAECEEETDLGFLDSGGARRHPATPSAARLHTKESPSV